MDEHEYQELYRLLGKIKYLILKELNNPDASKKFKKICVKNMKSIDDIILNIPITY